MNRYGDEGWQLPAQLSREAAAEAVQENDIGLRGEQETVAERVLGQGKGQRV